MESILFRGNHEGYSIILRDSGEWAELELGMPETKGNLLDSSYSLAIFNSLGAETIPAISKTWTFASSLVSQIGPGLDAWAYARRKWLKDEDARDVDLPAQVSGSWGERGTPSFGYLDLQFYDEKQYGEDSTGLGTWYGYDLMVCDRSRDTHKVPDSKIWGDQYWIIPAKLALRFQQTMGKAALGATNHTESLSHLLWTPRTPA